MPIRVLSEVVAAQIAAGEVVERPASVVKELIENALDAGATSITVEIEQGGKRLIRVSDDGSGISAEEASLAFARHSTSKLSTIDDLNRIDTLGFRGEALASIASVSRTKLVTRYHEEPGGMSVQVEGGEIRAERPTGAPVGTVVTVENLFFNTPARLKFMKANSTERKHISQLVTRYAMAYPDVRFQLVQEGREQFHSPGSGDLADVLVEAFGLEAFREMLEVSPQPAPRPDLPRIEVYGFVSTPDLNRARRDQIVLFVNGRAISDQSLSYAVVQAYHTLLPDGRYPVAVLLVTLPPGEVDVNVHPTKAEVRFRAPDAVFAAVQRAVRAVIADQEPAASAGAYGPGWTAPREPARSPVPGEQQLELELKALDPGHFSPGDDEDDVSGIPEGPGQPARPRTLPILRVIGQVGAAYIVAEGPAGVYLIDQHAAHHRVLYEQMKEQWEAGDLFEQEALKAETIELQRDIAAAVEAGRGQLAALGVDVEPFGGHTFRVRALPAALADEEPDRVLMAVGQALMDDTDSDRLLRQISKLAAVKAGEMLDYDAMQGIIQRLERCDSPRIDPEGKPTLLHISGEELSRKFGEKGQQ